MRAAAIVPEGAIAAGVAVVDIDTAAAVSAVAVVIRNDQAFTFGT